MLPFLFLFLAALVAGVGLLLYSGAEQASAQSGRPNVVVIMSDDQDVDSLPVMRNLLGYPQGSWVNFTNAFANTSICTPARATLLTGQYAHNHGAVGNNWGAAMDDNQTLAVWLDDAGYRTALIGKYLHSYEDLDIGDGTHVLPGWDYFYKVEGSVDQHTDMAVDFITADDSPFFLWLAYRGPHAPAAPPDRYLTADVFVPPDRPNFNEADMSDKPQHLRDEPLLGQTTLDKLRPERLASQRELLALDDGIQAVIDALAAAGKLDNTLVIFVGDNGFSWGSHRLYKKLCPYEECSRIPLFIRYPGLDGNRVETRYVSNVDLAATILDFTGVAPGAPQDGNSLLPLMSGQPADWGDAVLIEKAYGSNEHYVVRQPGWYYAEYNDGQRELYDMTADPYQLDNRADRPAYAAIQAELAQTLDALLGSDTGPTPTPTPTATPTPTPTPTATPDPNGEKLYISSSTGGAMAGMAYADEDILLHDMSAGGWAIHFDGSDVGVAAGDVDAFALLDDGSLLISLDAPINLANLGAVDDSDILRFAPATLGATTTSGSWSIYLDGSDVGLTANGEDIDALNVVPGGDLLISVGGKVTVEGVVAADEDLLRFTPSQLGPDSSGAWSLYFDGSDVALSASGEDLTGVWADPTGEYLYLNTLGSFKVVGLSGARSDIFICRPASLGNNTSCDFSLGHYWRGKVQGAGNVPLDGFAVARP